jgi:hypothetical protein
MKIVTRETKRGVLFFGDFVTRVTKKYERGLMR